NDIKEGDRVDPVTINRTFAEASDTAAKRALDTMRVTGLRGEETFLLLAEMSYQSGTLITSKRQAEKDMLIALGAGESEAALTALRKTAAYRYSGESRRRSYEAQLIKSLRGK